MRSFLSLFLLSFFIGCDFSLEKTLEIPELDFDEQIVVQCDLGLYEFVTKLHLTESRRITDNVEDNPAFVTDADIHIFYEGNDIGDFSFEDNIYDIRHQAIPGKYSLEINHSSISETIYAETIVPEPTTLMDVDYREGAGVHISIEGDADLLRITFDDPPGNNYYGINVFKSSASIFVATNEPGAFYRDGILYFDDSTFNGTTKTFDLVLDLFEFEEIEEGKLRFEWLDLSFDHYENINRLNILESSDGNPFAEPVSLYDNVEFGIGAFTGLTKMSYDIE